jgi:tetratricopeptide (TPR) repeat protein
MGQTARVAVLVITALLTADAAIMPVAANEPSACKVEKAQAFRQAGDRYASQANYADAARWYVAAARTTRACRAPSELLLSARALAQAGTALARGGDYLRALSMLRQAQAQLVAIGARDRATASEAQTTLGLVQNVISVVDDVAASSM